MKHTIALSVQNIINTVLARSALRHHLRADRPPLLNRGQTAALSLMARGIFASIAARIGAELGPDDPEILSLTLESESMDQRAVASALERAVVTSLLAETYGGTDAEISRYYQSHHQTALTDLTAILQSAAPASIHPSLF